MASFHDFILVWGISWNPSGKHFGFNIIFNIYINDLPEVCASEDGSSKLYLYAGDAKIFKVVSQITDQLDLQAIMNTVKTWSDEWLLRLNIDQCKTVSCYLKHPPLDTQYHIIDENTTHILELESPARGLRSSPPACTASLVVGSSKAPWPWPWIGSRSNQHTQYM